MKKTPILAILNLAEGFLCDSAAARENTVFPAFIFEWLAILNLADVICIESRKYGIFLALLYV